MESDRINLPCAEFILPVVTLNQISANGIPADQKIASATVIARTPAKPMLATLSNAVGAATVSPSPLELSSFTAYLSDFEIFGSS